MSGVEDVPATAAISETLPTGSEGFDSGTAAKEIFSISLGSTVSWNKST